MKRVSIYLALIVSLVFTYSCDKVKSENQKKSEVKEVTAKKPVVLESKLFLNLPETFNSPASGDIDSEGNIYFTSPNFHNDALIKSGDMKTPATPTIGKVDQNNQLTTWYTFKPEDMEKTSGKIAPFGLAFGPDGNAYLADMQLWFNGQSRILRINVEEGKATSIDVVAVGMSFPNALVWKGNDLYISDTVLGETEDGKHVSGIYKVNISELNAKNPVKISTSLGDENPHLFETFISNGSLKFGANGLAIDGEGNIYTGIMEEGTVLKTTVDTNNNVITTPFAKGMVATDGMKWDARTNKLYITDLFANAVYSIDMNGDLDLLVKNGNTNGDDGLLDAPSEVVIRGNEIIVLNFDATFDVPNMVNKSPDAPYTLSVITL
ncbi:NHL repeat-containing protein [Reichenbachiella versicolor]|uniref:hypothetical protein n=1 Tax=Reichenbachiella versicolor TaxID=1821036 RepID=UPI000D6E44BF|nr:hypothetical protein [Reichenbachiella versicolor]